MIEAAERLGVALVPSVAASASPAGPGDQGHLRAREGAHAGRPRPAAGRLDGVLLDLHGAMVPEGLDDGEGDIIAAVRRRSGREVPIAVTLDFHGNLSEAMVARRRSPPRLQDLPARGHGRARRRGGGAAPRGHRRTDPADRRVPAAAAPAAPGQPGHRAWADAAALRSRRRDGAGPRVVSISIFAGFPHADIPDAGLGVYVATDDDPELAEPLAERAGPDGVGAPARVRPPGAAGEGGGGPRLAADGPPHRARRHGGQHGRRRRRGRHRGAAGAPARGRALGRGRVPLGSGGGGGVRPRRRRRPRDAPGRRQGGRPPRGARHRHGDGPDAVRRALRPQGPDDARLARAGWAPPPCSTSAA